MIRNEGKVVPLQGRFFFIMWKTVCKEIETQSHYEVKMRRNQHI